MSLLRKHTILSLWCLIISFGATAQEKYQAINWNTDHGLIWGMVNTMLKDKEGFLWITSEFGLNRFDGNRFINYFPDKTKSGVIGGVPVRSLVEDSLNNIWIGTEKGLSRYDKKADSFTNFLPDPDPEHSSTAITPFWASKEELYCIESYSRIISFNIYTFKKRILAKLEFWSKRFAIKYSIFDAGSNSVWVLPGNEDGIIQVLLSTGEKKHHKRSVNKKVPHFSEQFNTETMCYDKKRNCIWINSHDGLIQFTLNNNQFHYTYSLNTSLSRKEYDHWAGIDIDPMGRVWMATQSKGLIIYDPANQSVTQPSLAPDLSKEVSEGNFSIYCDRDGMIWTSNWLKKGIHQLIPYKQTVTRYSPGEFLPKHWVGMIPSVVPADQGRLWIGSQVGLVILDQNTGAIQLLRENEMPGIKGKFINMMMIDTAVKKAWLNAWTPDDPNATDAIYEMDIPTKKCRAVIFKDTANRVIKPGNIVFYSANAYKNGFIFLDLGQGIFFVDRDSTVARQVLAFPQNPRVFIADSNKLILQGIGVYSDINGKWIQTPSRLDSMEWTSLLYDKADHSWWVGGSRQLIHFDTHFRLINRYTEKDGLQGREVSQILPDDHGNIWFANPEGTISMLNPKTGQIIILSEKDGFEKQFFKWQPSFTRDAAGILYFVGEEAIDRIDPAKLSGFPPSSAYILSLEVNQKPYPLQTGVNSLEKLSLRYFENIITIETGVIDYYSRGKSRIRYKLEAEGKDVAWEYAPAYYTIRFGSLPPGNYRLLIQASNASNEFNGPDKILQINISPPFWQTTWFRTLMGIVLVAFLYSIYRWRTANLRRQKRVLEQTVKERTAEVVEEKAEVERQKEKSEGLLLNILPSEVAEELKEKGYTTARSFDEVTVLFSDIKGFTNIAEKMTAKELVKEINTYFSAFDNIIEKNGLEKIKTIGDAYVAAGGIPEKNSATAQNVVEAAIAMQLAVEKLKQERVSLNKPYFELRIGIHTGPVVAGVVGTKKFQYDFWGDTVNLAARMEQSGSPGKINISHHTYEAVKDQFNCVHRGKIEAKNKGEIDMYFVEIKN